MSKYRNLIGLEVVDRRGKTLGKVTYVENDGGKDWLILDDAFAIQAEGTCEVHDLTHVRHYVSYPG